MKKIRLAVVDDELTGRNTIKRLLEGHPLYEVTADFASGRAALDWLRRNEVDILLCDMQMPEMNGVELIRSVHIIHEFLPVITISGFDDFNFVRGSLINGAANYLLKHELTQVSLVNALDQVCEKYRIVPEDGSVCQKAGYCIYDEQEFDAVSIRSMIEAGTIHFGLTNVIAVAISPDYKPAPGIQPKEYKQDISRAIIDMLNQMLGDKYLYLIGCLRDDQLILLLSFPGECSTLLMFNTVSNLAKRLQRQIIRMLDLTVTIINGDVKRELEAAILEAKQMMKLLPDKIYLGGNRVVMAAVTKPVIYSREELSDNLWRQLEFELENGGYGCIDTLYVMFERMERERSEKELVRQNVRRMVDCLNTYKPLVRQELEQILMQLEHLEIFEQFRTAVLDIYSRMIVNDRKQEPEYSDIIARAIDYIGKNYTSDISLEACAEQIGCSYTRISREFKRETGMRFVEYLNHKRVNKAKSLLIMDEYSMKQVAAMSGFNNYNYFFKVFKEIEGLTPSEFLTKN